MVLTGPVRWVRTQCLTASPRNQADRHRGTVSCRPAAPYDPSSQTPILRAHQEAAVPTDHSLQSPAVLYPTLPPPAPIPSRFPRYMFIVGADASCPTTTTAEVDRRRRIQHAAAALDGEVERLASPFGDGMTYTICQLPGNEAAASLATVMRAVYETGVRTVALPRSRHLYDRA